MEQESLRGLVPDRCGAADSDLEAVEQGHRHSVTNGGAEASGVGGREKDDVGEVKRGGEIVDAVARDGRLGAAGTEGGAEGRRRQNCWLRRSKPNW